MFYVAFSGLKLTKNFFLISINVKAFPLGYGKKHISSNFPFQIGLQ